MHGTTQIRSQESPKKRMVLGVFDASNYVTERQWATASDGTQIPISIIYHENLVKLDSSDPLLLYGYGSYEVCIDPTFKASRLSLLDRGFIYAIAHIRGEYLIDKYCCKEKLCINGRSAGGLLIGAVVNMRPDLFKAAVAGVPFVDFVTTMLDSTIPLTTSEWEEWGDPRKEEFYYYMKSYSPVDNGLRLSLEVLLNRRVDSQKCAIGKPPLLRKAILRVALPYKSDILRAIWNLPLTRRGSPQPEFSTRVRVSESDTHRALGQRKIPLGD
ncbi:hypothetical protein T459_24075 [Capsicum annuum]|uniref:Prolyl endopeptidase n=1 Tax=Capsicum annuum TaxID=4072 RepID=A0A2G2YU61_CAPAN|nr:hypothetical protein T459_24075 [Capsicum annuum]